MNLLSSNFYYGYEGIRQSRLGLPGSALRTGPDMWSISLTLNKKSLREQGQNKGSLQSPWPSVLKQFLCRGEENRNSLITLAEMRSEVSESGVMGAARVCEAEYRKEKAMQAESSRNQPRKSLELLAGNHSLCVQGEILQDWGKDPSWGKSTCWGLSVKKNLQSLSKAGAIWVPTTQNGETLVWTQKM